MNSHYVSHEKELKHYLGCLYESEKHRGKSVNAPREPAASPGAKKSIVAAIVSSALGVLTKLSPMSGTGR